MGKIMLKLFPEVTYLFIIKCFKDFISLNQKLVYVCSSVELFNKKWLNALSIRK